MTLRYNPRNGKGHEIRHLEGEEPIYFWVTYDSGQGSSEVYIRVNGCTGTKKELKEQVILLSSMVKGMKIINWEQDLRTQENSTNS